MDLSGPPHGHISQTEELVTLDREKESSDTIDEP
jgi:hypothetical protein